MAYGIALGHERFGPRELLDQAVAAEQAGFDLGCCAARPSATKVAAAVVVMNVSGADPVGTIRLYGEHVLPRLRS